MKHLRSRSLDIDAIDTAIIRTLGAEARMTMADLARRVGLSAPSVSERVRRLEEAGVIQSYRAQVNPAALGLPLAAFIRIRPMPGQLQKVAQLIHDMEVVVECDRVTGDDCFIARVHVRSVEDLEAVIDKIIPYAVTNTSIIQSTPVPRRLPPLPLSLVDGRAPGTGPR